MSFSIPLVAFWSFASAWMLLWALAAAATLLIHLWSRRRYQETSWAAMEFLLAAIRKNARRMAFEQWLLLVLRIAVLVLFAIALAQPLFTWAGRNLSPGGQGKTFTLLVIDASFSMDYRAADRSRFDQARELARKIVLQGSQGEGFSLLLLADPPQLIVRQPVFDPGSVLEEIAALKVSHGGANLSGALAIAQQVLVGAKQNNPQLVTRRVVFFTDLEETTWESVNSTACREQLAKLSELATLTLVDLGSSDAANVAVTGLRPATSPIIPGRPAEFQVEVQRFGNSDEMRVAVELFVNGLRVQEEYLDLSSGGATSLRWMHAFDAPGEHLLQARVRDPKLLADNSRWLSVPVRDALRVLCLEGRPREARHLALALEPQRSDNRRILVTEAPDSALLDRDLSAFDAICLCNVPHFTADEAEILKRFVARGGGLMIFLGDQVQAEHYNATLGARPGDAASAALLPARLAPAVGGSQYRFNPLEYRHPILAPFRGQERSGLLTTPVWKYFPLRPQPNAQTALAFANGDAALVAGNLGRGRTLLFATAASSQSLDRSVTPPLPWTAIDAWPSFPPLVHEMLEYVVAGETASRNTVLGSEISGSVRNNPLGSSVTIITPSGKSEQVPLIWQGDEAVWSFQADTSAGPYQMVSQSEGAPEIYAVNVETRESALATLAAEQLPSQFAREIRDNATHLGAILESPRAWFRWFLLAVFGLLAIESCVAWRMSR